MKIISKVLRTALVLVFIAALAACATDGGSAYVDAYTSATETTMKSTLSGPALDAVAKILASGSSDLANAATAKAPGYTAPKSFIVHVLTTNPDGSVGISTISQWAFKDVADGPDQAVAQLTWGQNALNIAEAGKRWSLFIPGVPVDGKNGRYLLHLRVIQVDVLKYSDEAFEAGKFNSYYSGKAARKSQYTITSEVMRIEEVTGSVKLGLQMP